MTRATFTERLWAYDRLWRWVLVAAGLLVMLMVAAGPQLAQVLLERWWRRPEEPEERRDWVLVWSAVSCLMMSGLTLLALLLVIWGRRWAPRRFGLLCPSCGVVLAEYRHAALGAGTCGRCQAPVVEDAPPCLGGAPLPTRDEFLARLEEYNDAHQRQGQWYIRAVLLSFLPGFLVGWPFRVYQEPSLRPVGLLWLAVLLFLVALTSPFLVCWYFVSRSERRLQQSHGMVCRWCGAGGAGFTGARGKTAAATGRCGACGQPAWTDAAEPVLQPIGPA
jgi:hypothetical protein